MTRTHLRATRIYVSDSSAAPKQNVTLSLDRELVRRVKILAAKRSVSISGLIARELERLACEDDAYERAKGKAFSLLDDAFDLGNARIVDREKLHEREKLR